MRTILVMGAWALASAVALAQTAAPGPEGTWRGTLDTGGPQLRLVLRINKAPDGLLTGLLDSLDQGTTIPIDRIVAKGSSVRLELKAVAGTFEGTLSADGAQLKGTWTQGAPLPLSFSRD